MVTERTRDSTHTRNARRRIHHGVIARVVFSHTLPTVPVLQPRCTSEGCVLCHKDVGVHNTSILRGFGCHVRYASNRSLYKEREQNRDRHTCMLVSRDAHMHVESNVAVCAAPRHVNWTVWMWMWMLPYLLVDLRRPREGCTALYTACLLLQGCFLFLSARLRSCEGCVLRASRR